MTPPLPATRIPYLLTPLGLRTVPVLRGKRLRARTAAVAGAFRADAIRRVEAELREGPVRK